MRIKRLFDFTIATIGIVVLGPLFLLIALLILGKSGPPVLFRQARVGQFERQFEIIKFRTMQCRAADARKVTSDGDDRITNVGRWLRRAKLDELPQLINVVRGDMSLVGPRPEVPEFVKCYPVELRPLLFSVKPGITDPATIQFRNESEILSRVSSDAVVSTYVDQILPIKVAHYVEYVTTRSFWGDIGLIFKTMYEVARG